MKDLQIRNLMIFLIFSESADSSKKIFGEHAETDVNGIEFQKKLHTVIKKIVLNLNGMLFGNSFKCFAAKLVQITEK